MVGFLVGAAFEPVGSWVRGWWQGPIGVEFGSSRGVVIGSGDVEDPRNGKYDVMRITIRSRKRLSNVWVRVYAKSRLGFGKVPAAHWSAKPDDDCTWGRERRNDQVENWAVFVVQCDEYVEGQSVEILMWSLDGFKKDAELEVRVSADEIKRRYFYENL